MSERSKVVARPTVTESRAFSKQLPGRKAGELAVSVTSNEVARFELRVDANAGTWIVVSDGLLYTCTDKGELKEHMRALLRAARKVTWTRYIVLDYEAEGPGGFTNRRRYRSSDRKRDGEDLEIGSIRLDWEVMDFSEPLQHPGQSKPRRKERRVFDSGIGLDPNAAGDDDDDRHTPGYSHESWMNGDTLPDGAVRFTPDRYALLVEVRKALGRLDAKLATLFIGANPVQLAAQLDRAGLRSGIAGLLAPPRAQHQRSDHEGDGPCAACAPCVGLSRCERYPECESCGPARL